MEDTFDGRCRWNGPACTGLVEAAEERLALDQARELGEALVVLRPTASVGLSRPHAAVAVREAFAEARRASIYALTTPGHEPRTITDFPVEEALARDHDALRYSARCLDGLDDELQLSLTVFYGMDGNRERAATALVVHLRTLDYRLRRIRHLTGLAPRSLYGSRVLRAALTAHELLMPPTVCLPAVREPSRPETGVRT